MTTNLGAAAPEIVIISSITLLIILDLFLKRMSHRLIGILSIIAVFIAGGFVVLGFHHAPSQILGDTFRVDKWSLFFKILILAGTVLVQFLSLSKDQDELQEAKAEYYYLLLSAVLGAMIMVSSADLITLYVGLELLSLSSYILVGIRRHMLSSNESAWKYMILGGVSSAFILYGMSFLYGITGTTNLFEVQNRLMGVLGQGYDIYIYLSFILMMVGFGFKITAVPFQMWTPDVYQGAFTPITAFLSTVSKLTSFAFAIRILLIVFSPLLVAGGWKEIVAPLLVILSILSMIVGNCVALRQTNMKRLMAYSSIAQIGYILVPFATFIVHIKFLLLPMDSLIQLFFSSTFYYLIVYLVMNIGAFAVLFTVIQNTKNEEISAFAGLHERAPWLALAMTVFLISLAGLPVTAGFFGKFFLITYAIAGQNFWLVGVMILTTVVSYYYYFGVIRQIYFRSVANGSEQFTCSWPINVVIIVCLIGTIGLGFAPQWIMNSLGQIDWVSSIQPIK